MTKRRTPWILAAALLLVPVMTPCLPAQDPEALLKEAIDLYERGRDEEALEKLKAVLAADPSSELAWSLRNSVEFRTWARVMIKGGEHEAVVRHLFELGLPEAQARKSDPEAIRNLISQLESGDFPARQRASVQLAADHGEYAVPFLLPRLRSDSTETRATAMEWLRRLGSLAVMPLVQALEMDDPAIQANVLTVLGQIGDRRAIPYVVAYAEGPVDAAPTVRNAAERALQDLNRSYEIVGGAVPLLLQMAEGYYRNDPMLEASMGGTYVVWAFADGRLVPREVTRDVYALKAAEEILFDVMAWEPTNMDAQVLLASVLLAEEEVARGSAMMPAPGEGAGEEGGDAPQEASGPAGRLMHASEMVASLGEDVIDAALQKALEDGRPAVAAGALRHLGRLLSPDMVGGSPGLIQALAAPYKEVRFLSAITVARLRPEQDFAGKELVVPNLMEALGQDALRMVVVIDDVPDTRNRIVADLNAKGYFAYGTPSGALGIAHIRNYPIEDMVIIRYNLQDRTVHEVIRMLKADERTQDRPIVMLVDQDDATAAKEAYEGRVAAFLEPPYAVDAYEPTLRALFQELDPAREAATQLAAAAAQTLAHMRPTGDAFSSAPAVPALVGTLKGDDRVRIPAMRALGRIGDASALPPVLEVFNDGSASEDVRGNAAVAMARMARASGTLPAEAQSALFQAVQGEGSLAYLRMLGEACGIAPLDHDQRAELLAALRNRIIIDMAEEAAGGGEESPGN